MNQSQSNETFVDLARSIANALEDPSCPQELAESLTEVANQLFGLFEEGRGHLLTVAMLRAVVGKAESANGTARPEAEKARTAQPGAKAGV